MNAKNLRWLMIGYCALLLIVMVASSGQSMGMNATWYNGQYTYQAGSSPWMLGMAVAGAALYFWLLSSKTTPSPNRMPLLFRRWVAGFIDFVWAFTIPAAFIGLLAVLLEYRRTGTFQWLVERHNYQAGDGPVASASVLLTMFAIMPSYFALCWRSGKPTPGSCICRFRIVADVGTKLIFWKAGLRALLGSMALLAWPCWILAYWVKRDQSAGKFWLDAIFDTHAEYIE